MVDSKAYEVRDFFPLSIQFINEAWEPSIEDYVYTMPEGQNIENKKTTEKGFVLSSDLEIGRRIKLTKPKAENEEEQRIEYTDEIIEYPANPGPLPVLDLIDRSKGGKGPLNRKDSRRYLIKHLQRMLINLGYDLGTSGQEQDGVDGIFLNKTRAAVEMFQKSHKDWNGEQLRIDGVVGPRTGDALNREFVGIWYPKYETPLQITSGRKFIVMTEEYGIWEGLIIE